MIRTPATLTLLGAAAALAACDKAPEASAASDGATTAPAATRAVALQPGRYRMTATFLDVAIASEDPRAKQAEAAMKQALAGKPNTEEVCISQADIDGGLNKLFVTPGNECQAGERTLAGGTIDVTYRCTSEAGQTGTIRTTGGYTPTSVRTETTVTTQVQTDTMTMKAATEGQRLGDC